jgi:hypothetical protein
LTVNEIVKQMSDEIGLTPHRILDTIPPTIEIACNVPDWKYARQGIQGSGHRGFTWRQGFDDAIQAGSGDFD